MSASTCGSRVRTCNLRGMNPARFRCAIPPYQPDDPEGEAKQKRRAGVQPCTACYLFGTRPAVISRRPPASGKTRPGCLLIIYAGGWWFATGKGGSKADCSVYGILDGDTRLRRVTVQLGSGSAVELSLLDSQLRPLILNPPSADCAEVRSTATQILHAEAGNA